MHIRIELWMWLGDKLGCGFKPLSEMRSFREIEVEEGLTVIRLFERLAAQDPFIEEKIFDRENKKFHPNLSVIVTLNDQVVSPFNVEESALLGGCKVTVLPIYVGG